MNTVSENRVFEGVQRVYTHQSEACGGEMTFAVYLPPQAEEAPVPALYWLSGLTCSHDNFMTKAGAQRVASELGMAIVMPDTSPRGAGYPGEDESWDFGTGAGFYVDATVSPWSERYRMYSYITEELPALLESTLPLIAGKRSISGHSMGGHGALIAGLKEPSKWASVSAFSPICAPKRCPWGVKAFTGYLGEDQDSWDAWDASLLVGHQQHGRPLLIDQGEADSFLQEQLYPDVFKEACAASGQALQLRMRPGYDHSYYFISTFIEEHLRFHHAALKV